jgi:NADH-quinone oxidoreductase subunit A
VTEYVGILVFIVLAGAVAALLLALASALGPRHPTLVKSEPFECGELPFSVPIGRQSVKFYLTAILFVIFDVEIVLLYPWAVVYQALGSLGFVEAVVFLGVLMIGFYYAWDNGALEWQ